MKRSIAFLLFMLLALMSLNAQVVGPRSFTNHAVTRVEISGTDAYGIKGRWDRPYASITNAWTNLVSGDSLTIGRGTWTVNPLERSYSAISNSPLMISNLSNITISGAGQGNTVIYVTNLGTLFCIRQATNIIFRDFTIQCPYIYTNLLATDYFAAFLLHLTNSNIKFQNITIDGWPHHGIADLINVKTCYDVVVENCTFKNIGSTNHASLVHDGSAIASIGSRAKVIHNYFENCNRDVEFENYDFNAIAQEDILCQGNTHNGTKAYAYWFTTKNENTNLTSAAMIRNVRIVDNCISNMVTTADSSGGKIFGVIVTCGENFVIANNVFDKIVAGVSPPAIGAGCVYLYTDSSSAFRTIRNVQIANNIFRNFDDAIYIDSLYDDHGVITNINIQNNIFINGDPFGWQNRETITIGGAQVMVHDNVFQDASGLHGRQILVITNSYDVGIYNNYQYNRKVSAAYRPEWVLQINPGATNVWYRDNTFNDFLIRAVTNASYATGLPCRQIGTNAPSDTIDYDPDGSTWVTTTGGMYIRTNGVWKIMSSVAAGQYVLMSGGSSTNQFLLTPLLSSPQTTNLIERGWMQVDTGFTNVTGNAHFQGGTTYFDDGAEYNSSVIVNAGTYIGDGGGLTNINSGSITGTISGYVQMNGGYSTNQTLRTPTVTNATFYPVTGGYVSSTFGSNVLINGDLTNNGGAYLLTNLNVGGSQYLSNNLTVLGSTVTLNSNLNIGGSQYLSNNLTVLGTASTLNSNLNIGGTITVTNATVLNGALMFETNSLDGTSLDVSEPYSYTNAAANVVISDVIGVDMNKVNMGVLVVRADGDHRSITVPGQWYTDTGEQTFWVTNGAYCGILSVNIYPRVATNCVFRLFAQ